MSKLNPIKIQKKLQMKWCVVLKLNHEAPSMILWGHYHDAFLRALSVFVKYQCLSNLKTQKWVSLAFSWTVLPRTFTSSRWSRLRPHWFRRCDLPEFSWRLGANQCHAWLPASRQEPLMLINGLGEVLGAFCHYSNWRDAKYLFTGRCAPKNWI